VRFHELGHAAIRLKYGKRDNIPDSVPAILGLPDTPETREALDRQVERARVYAYGDYRQDPDKESTPSEKAADIVGLSMMDPDAIGAPSVAPQALAAANLFVSGVDPILASAAGLNAQVPAANLNNRPSSGQPPTPPTPPTAGVAASAGNNGVPGPESAQSGAGNGAQPQQPPGVGHPYGAMADWMSQAQTSGAMYTMRSRMKDGVYQFSVDKLKEPGKDNVPTIDALIDQVGKSGEYYAELNPWIQRLEEAMKTGVHDMKGLSSALRRSQAALKDMYTATPKPWEYNLSLSRKGQPGIAEHDRFNTESNARLKQIKEAQHQVSFMQNRLRMTQIQEGVMDLETYGDYTRDKYDKGPRGGGGRGGGRGGGMGQQDDQSPWGVFTDQMGGFAGLGWLGWGMFGLQRVNNFAFDGIREDIEMFRGGQSGLDTMRRAEMGMAAGSPLTLTQQLTGNDFIKNYVKMQTGEKFQGWSTAVDDTWNRLYSVDEQVGIHTTKEMTKGVLGAVAGALITGNMLSKTGKTVRAAGTALGAMAGFQAMEEGETPQEEDGRSVRDNLVTTAINLAVGGGFVVEKFGKKAVPKAAEAVTQAAGKYAPKGLAQAIGYYGLGKFGATALGKGAAWLGKNFLTKAIPGVAQVAMGAQGALMGMGALASLVPEGDRDPVQYEQYLEGSPVSRSLAPWLADKTPWAPGLQKSVKGLVDFGNDNTLGKLTGQTPREPSAAQERVKAVKAMQSGDLSTLPIKDHEDLMFYLGAAGAGQTPEEVSRYAGRFMALTGNTLDDLKDPTNPATKLMYTMVSQAVREQVNVNTMEKIGFSVASEVGLLPNNPRGQRMADDYLTMPTIQQEQLGLGLGFVSQWNNDRMGLSVGAQTQMGYNFGTKVAPNYTTGQISRSMRLVQPSTPYEYNLSLSKGILTPQNIESGWGIPAGNIGATMDLSTGLPSNYDAMIANEDYTRGLSRGYSKVP
jgi:hypothetical protein